MVSPSRLRASNESSVRRRPSRSTSFDQAGGLVAGRREYVRDQVLYSRQFLPIVGQAHERLLKHIVGVGLRAQPDGQIVVDAMGTGVIKLGECRPLTAPAVLLEYPSPLRAGTPARSGTITAVLKI